MPIDPDGDAIAVQRLGKALGWCGILAGVTCKCSAVGSCWRAVRHLSVGDRSITGATPG